MMISDLKFAFLFGFSFCEKSQESESYIDEIEGFSIILHARDLFSVNLLSAENLFHLMFYEMYNNSIFGWFVALLLWS